MDPSRMKKMILPQVRPRGASGSPEPPAPPERPGLYPCPCCGRRTFPVPPAEALAYICPV